MNKAEILILKRQSLKKWRHIQALVGKLEKLQLCSDSCGYCSIYADNNCQCTCDGCPLAADSLCGRGGGKAYRKIVDLSNSAYEQQRDIVRMVMRIEKDIAKDAGRKP